MNVVQRLVVVLLFGMPLWVPAHAQAPAALAGKVSSAEEGAMEGVLVSAKKAGSTITVTVVSDAKGRYSFPAKKLSPGKYALQRPRGRLRARVAASIDASASRRRRRISSCARPKDLAAQLSNGEWMHEHARATTGRRASCSTASAATRSSASRARATTPIRS